VKRLEFLDALRGIAAVIVVTCHMFLLPQPNLELPVWADTVVRSGGNGVALFFVMSAFSLFYTMPQRAGEARPLLSFYLRRVFRIAPLFYAWLAFRLALGAWTGQPAPSPLAVAANVLFVFNLIPSLAESLVWAGWTVGIEVVFYALFPLIYRSVTNVWRAVTFTFLLIAASLALTFTLDVLPLDPATAAPIQNWSVIRHLPIFASGGVIYFLLRRLQRQDEGMIERRSLGLMLVVVAGYAYLAYIKNWLPPIFGPTHYWVGVIFAALTIGLALNPIPLIVNRVTTFLGTIGFSLYLNHPLTVYLLIPVYRRIYAGAPNVSVSFVACVLLTFAILVPVSFVTYRLIELPGIRAGKWAYRRAAARLDKTPSLAA
jgi:peptidoglycan/LPS O-acetylase OafA/YrhL